MDLQGQILLCLRHSGASVWCPAPTILVIPELLFGVYTLSRPRRMLRAVELGAQVGSLTTVVLSVVDANLRCNSFSSLRNLHFSNSSTGSDENGDFIYYGERHIS